MVYVLYGKESPILIFDITLFKIDITEFYENIKLLNVPRGILYITARKRT